MFSKGDAIISSEHQTENDQKQEKSVIEHAALAQQPGSVHELSASLYAPYNVHGGSIRLGGCSFEDVGILVVSKPGNSKSRKLYYLDGGSCDQKLYEQLGLDRISKVKGLEEIIAQPSAREEVLVQLDGVVKENAIKPSDESLVVWGKWADGKLIVEIGSRIGEIPFKGWARQFVEGPIRPPMFECKLSKLQSYEITVDDDGAFTVPEAIEQCELTGKNVVRTKLATCAVTKVIALKSKMVQCGASGQYVVQRKLAKCWGCYQPTNPKSMKLWKCPACQQLESVPRVNEFLQQLFALFPGLKRAQQFKIGHAGARTVGRAHLDSQKVMLVADHDMANAEAFVKKWPFGYRPLTKSESEQMLGEK